MSLIYKELSKCNNSLTEMINYKLVFDSFSHNKIILLNIIREMQIKNKTIYHLILVRMIILKKTTTKKKKQVLVRRWRKGSPCGLLVGTSTGAVTANSVGLPQNLNTRAAI